MPPGITAGSDQPTGPLVTFRSQDIFPPTALYVGPGDALHFEFKTPGFTGNAFLAIRFLSPQGEIIPEFYTLQVTASNVANSVMHIPHAEGFILSAVISAGAQSRGQAFAQLKLHIGGGSGQEVHAHILCQGYLTAYDSLAYPLSPPESSISGRGFPLVLVFGPPFPTAFAIVTVPAGRRWIIRGANCRLVTSAVVGNRTMNLTIDDGGAGDNGIIAYATMPQAANLQVDYSWGGGLTTTTQVAFQNMGLPNELALLAGWRLLFGPEGLQLGDQVGGPKILVEEFIAQ
jgi:hypothetical protein